MVGIDKGFFLQLRGDSKKRVLHPAKVVDISADLFTASVEEADLAVEAEQDVLVYYDHRAEFVQQSATIHEVHPVDETSDAEALLNVVLSTRGEAVSAESRQFHRVSTVMMDLVSEFSPELRCPILDVSARGFSVASVETFQLGEVKNATIEFEGETFSGKVCVQSIKELTKGRTRYGLYCTEKKGPQKSLANGLPQMSIAVQREQLCRMSGAF